MNSKSSVGTVFEEGLVLTLREAPRHRVRLPAGVYQLLQAPARTVPGKAALKRAREFLGRVDGRCRCRAASAGLNPGKGR